MESPCRSRNTPSPLLVNTKHQSINHGVIAANWSGHAAWPSLTDSRERLGKSGSRATSKFGQQTSWMLLDGDGRCVP